MQIWDKSARPKSHGHLLHGGSLCPSPLVSRLAMTHDIWSSLCESPPSHVKLGAFGTSRFPGLGPALHQTSLLQWPAAAHVYRGQSWPSSLLFVRPCHQSTILTANTWGTEAFDQGTYNVALRPNSLDKHHYKNQTLWLDVSTVE